MKFKKQPFIFIPLFLIILSIILFIFLDIDLNSKKNITINSTEISNKWNTFSNGIYGKIIYAVPPEMHILYLKTGKKIIIPGIKTEGGPGRFNRGKTPRPFWNRDGTLFVYRFKGNVFISDETGEKRTIFNPYMDRSKETRWSFTYYKGREWIAGPSLSGNVILVNPINPKIFIDLFIENKIDKHCEMTGDGKYIVYDNGKDIFLKNTFKKGIGMKISFGQSCRPCASPQKYVGWLPAPHLKYYLYFASDGKLFKELPAPINEEIYRLNWSNSDSFAVHMFGSRGNNKMTVRNIHTGKSFFAGYGWDPDLWVKR